MKTLQIDTVVKSSTFVFRAACVANHFPSHGVAVSQVEIGQAECRGVGPTGGEPPGAILGRQRAPTADDERNSRHARRQPSQDARTGKKGVHNFTPKLLHVRTGLQDCPCHRRATRKPASIAALQQPEHETMLNQIMRPLDVCAFHENERWLEKLPVKVAQQLQYLPLRPTVAKRAQDVGDLQRPQCGRGSTKRSNGGLGK